MYYIISISLCGIRIMYTFMALRTQLLSCTRSSFGAFFIYLFSSWSMVISMYDILFGVFSPYVTFCCGYLFNFEFFSAFERHVQWYAYDGLRDDVIVNVNIMICIRTQRRYWSIRSKSNYFPNIYAFFKIQKSENGITRLK